ncbi:MAG TPA: PQQ-binding-like beta-propeller repeat protein [Pedobacter sp.]|nr:PQQ-binding-like beta-propeller repeat protein [Pedobacter sp.]
MLSALILAALLHLSCNSTSLDKNSWTTYLDKIGSSSSSRTADLNNDGVLDVVMGTGGKENFHCDTAVIAIDGATGKLLWKASADNQIVGSAIFRDINYDGVPDVFIGGRWSELMALDGTNGKLIWKFFDQRKTPNPADSGWYNFTTPQFVPDQDLDGLEDLIVANGGNPLVPPNDPDRPAGRLLVLSSSSGKILANVKVPDGRETYMSVVCLKTGDDISIFFGTGGETIGGHLYRTKLKDIMRGDISNAKILATSDTKGFIGPPVLVDITADGFKDIVVNAVDGRLMAINGKNDALIWQVQIPGSESYSTPAVGHFNEDDVPDFFTNYGIGTFPNLPKSKLFMVDGKIGKIGYEVTVLGYQYSSPVSADLNGDGYDEVLINKNEMGWKNKTTIFYSYLVAFNFKESRQYVIGDTLQGSNEASTPWIGDLDKDNYLDVIYSAVKFNAESTEPLNPLGFSISRYSTSYKVTKPVKWGAYMGTEYTGLN